MAAVKNSRVKYLLFIMLILIYSDVFSQQKLSSIELERGKKLFYSSKYEKAINVLSRLIETKKLSDKEKEEAHLYLGFSYAQNRQIYLAEEELEEVLDLNPDKKINPEHFNTSLVQLFEEIKKDVIGRLEVYTNPEGAEIYIDGKIAGKSPLIIDKIVSRKYNILTLKNGYRAYEQKVTVRPGKNNKFELNLEENKNKGHIIIHSTPEGADLYIDDVPVGKTPLVIKNINYGKHKFRFEKRNYDPRTGTLIINDSKSTFLKIKLSKRRDVLTLSELFPGLGQFQKKRYIHGAFFSGATLGFLVYFVNFTSKNRPNKGKPYMNIKYDGYYIGDKKVSKEDYDLELALRAREREEYYNKKHKILVVGTLIYIINLVDIYLIDRMDQKRNLNKKPEKFGFSIESNSQYIACRINFSF